VLDLRDWAVIGYDSMMGHCTDEERNRIVEELARNIVRFLDAIEYWRHAHRKRELQDTTEFLLDMLDDVPQQDGDLGDCGVWVCRNMETHVNRQERMVSGDTQWFAREYRKRMMDTFFRARYDWEPPKPPPPPPA
jgi:Ulp1 family protease